MYNSARDTEIVDFVKSEHGFLFNRHGVYYRHEAESIKDLESIIDMTIIHLFITLVHSIDTELSLRCIFLIYVSSWI